MSHTEATIARAGRNLSNGHRIVSEICVETATNKKAKCSEALIAVKTDKQLMADYVGGDAEAFRLLYSRYETSLYRYLYNGCQNESQALELFQDIWMRVVKSKECYDASGAAPFNAWLFRIAKNRLIDTYRQQASSALDQSSDDKLHADPDTLQHEQFSSSDTWARIALTPEQIAHAAQNSETLRDALHRLPAHQREAIMLKHIAGMNLKEIAQFQGEALQTVKSRLRYAMVKLRHTLKAAS